MSGLLVFEGLSHLTLIELFPMKCRDAGRTVKKREG